MPVYPRTNPEIGYHSRESPKYCATHLDGAYTIEVVDLLEHPHLAEGEQIVATPTLIKKLPAPVRLLVGDVSREDQFLVGLNLVPLKK